MDNFMDKLAQRLNAQEVIHANSEAEAAEMKKLQMQIAEYERMLQEARKVNVKNVELSDKIDSLVGENATRMKDLHENELKLLNVLKELTEEQTQLFKEEQELANEKKSFEESRQQDLKERTEVALSSIEEMFRQADDFTHKENVKVYRNVQAVVIDELKQQTQELTEQNRKTQSKINLVTILSILTFLMAAVSAALQILNSLNIRLW